MSQDLPSGRAAIGVPELLRAGAARLAQAGIETPGREARLLLACALGLDMAGLLARRGEAVDAGIYPDLLARRAAREPMALILGHQEFWSLDFLVSPATLIPRPDSEALIEAALAALPRRGRVRRILDLGTGTGCLLLAALSEFPAGFGIGIDKVPAAARLAAGNAARLGLASRSAFLAADWAAAIGGEGFDLVLSNPPYIRSTEMAGLMPEVRLHEPASALDGGLDGLAAYAHIIADLPRLLAADGVAVLELGAGQAEAVAGLARELGFSVSTHADLAGHPRAMVMRHDGAKLLGIAGRQG